MNKEIEIPEGYEARIEGNKVILEPKESEYERIRKVLLRCCYDWDSGRSSCVAIGDVPAIRAYLEKQKDEAQRQFNLGVQAGKEEVMYEMEKEQKSAEWSEEDDALLKEIVSFFRDGTVKLQHDIDLYAGFLEKKYKSISPQNHWKPSEEQMDILDKVYHYLWADRNATADMQDGLGDFIDELKSL